MPDPAPAAAPAPVAPSEPPSNSADLLQLSGANPFANVLNAGATTTAAPPAPQNAFGSAGNFCWIYNLIFYIVCKQKCNFYITIDHYIQIS